MNKLSREDRVRVIACLVEGNSIRSTCRMTGVAKNTVVKLLVDAGLACTEYQDKTLRNLKCKRIQCDEIWAFVGAKEKNVPMDERGNGRGDVWTWTAMDPDSKLVPCWLVGNRELTCAYNFIHDLASRLSERVQLTTDGHKAYLNAVDKAFGADIDYGQLVKIYGNEKPMSETRYSPAVCKGAKKTVINGHPDFSHISTSITERQNLTMRMSMRRFTRLTNAFSKKVENHAYAVGLHFMYYNFCRIHQSLRVTPAMESGVSDHVWEISEIIELLEGKLN